MLSILRSMAKEKISNLGRKISFEKSMFASRNEEQLDRICVEADKNLGDYYDSGKLNKCKEDCYEELFQNDDLWIDAINRLFYQEAEEDWKKEYCF